MFRSLISCLCPNMKLIASFLKKLWQLMFFPALVWRYRGRCYFTPNAQHLTKHNFVTTYRIKVVDPSLESPGAALDNRSMFGYPISSHFCWRQHFLWNFQAKIRKWRRMTSRDVTTSDFHQTFTKCFLPSYVTCVQIWSHLHMFSESYGHLLFLRLI